MLVHDMIWLRVGLFFVTIAFVFFLFCLVDIWIVGVQQILLYNSQAPFLFHPRRRKYASLSTTL